MIKLKKYQLQNRIKRLESTVLTSKTHDPDYKTEIIL
jgi:cell division protein FtsL